MVMRALAPAILFAAIAVPLPAAAETDDDWHFSITPYIWGAHIQGEVAALPGRPPLNVDIDFDTLTNQLEGALMLQGEVRKGRWGVLANIDYLAVSGSRGLLVGDIVPLEGEAEVATLNGTITGFYRVYDNGRFELDALAGARYSSVGVELDVNLGPASFSGEQDKEWWDPVIGMRGRYHLGGRTGLTLYGDYGGFGVSSESVWQVYGGLTYQLTDWASAAVGYRWYSVDYEDGPFALDVEFAGPLIGARFDF